MKKLIMSLWNPEILRELNNLRDSLTCNKENWFIPDFMEFVSIAKEFRRIFGASYIAMETALCEKYGKDYVASVCDEEIVSDLMYNLYNSLSQFETCENEMVPEADNLVDLNVINDCKENDLEDSTNCEDSVSESCMVEEDLKPSKVKDVFDELETTECSSDFDVEVVENWIDRLEIF